MIELRESPQGVLLPLKVVPGASRSKLVGPLGKALKITVAAPAERGKANKEVLRLLSKSLGIKKSDLSMVHGETTPEKVVLVARHTVQTLSNALQSVLSCPD